MRRTLRAFAPYLVAVLAVLAALLLRWPFAPVFGPAVPYITFFPAVLVAAYFGGFLPGLLATALGAAAAVYLVVEPHHPFRLADPADAAGLSLFLLGGAAMSLLCESLHRAGRRQADAARLTREGEERLRVTLTSIGDAVLVTDAAGRVTFLNPVAEYLTGWALADATGRPFGEVFRILNERTREPAADPIGRVLREGKVVGLSNHTLLIARDGAERPIEDSAAPVKDAGDRVVGVVLVFRDVSDERHGNRRLLESEERFAGFMRHLPGLAWIKDAGGRYVFANEAAATAFGVPREQLPGKTDAELFPPATAARFRANDRQALDGGAGVQVIESLRHPDGTTHHSLVSKFPIPGPHGGPALVGGVAFDVTDRMRAEEAVRFLAEAGEVLSSSLDPEATLSAVARLVVPRLADWCSVYLTDADGGLRRLAVAHADPGKVARAEEVAVRYPPDPGDSRGVGGVIRSGEPVLIPEVNDELLVEVARDADHLALLRGLGLRSAMIVPLTARDRTLGVVTFAAAESGRRYGPDDLNLARDLARRAALAVDNARLFRDSAETLRLLGLLVEASGRLTSSPEPAAVGAAILDLSHRLVAADAHAIWRLDAATEEWLVADSAGLSAAYLGSGRVPVGGPPPDRPIIAEDAQGATDLESRRAAYRAEGIESVLAVPLRIHGRVGGTLVFYYKARRRFDEVTVRVASALGDLAGAALGTAELYARESSLRRLAEEEGKRKDEFLAALGHELRNPLTVLVSGLHALRELGPRALDRVPGMERQADTLRRLVDDLLDMARVSQGRIDLRRETVRLADVVARAVETARPVIDARRHTLAVEMPAGDVWLDGDPVRLTQCVSNLLHNAAKYTEPGGRISLTVELEAGGTAGKSAHALIRVRDTGIGIPAGDLERVFEMFAQVGDARARSQGGLGIGLSLVRRLVGMMGGTVTASSEGPGKGSEFVIRLPAASPPPTPAAPATPPPAAAARPLRVVIADDNEDAAETLAVLVGMWGHEVRVANDGPGAVTAAREFRPDVCLLDIGMPGFDGYEAARRVLADPELGGVVLIAMTGFGQDGDRERGRQAGFHHFMVKPVAPAAVERLLRETPRRNGGR